MNKKINVTKTYLPPFSIYKTYLQKVWKSNRITNNGPLLLELEAQLKKHLDVKNLFVVNSGTAGLQLALKALDVHGEVITTPFTYIASSSSIIWEQAKPVFVDIDPKTLCIDVDKIEKAITKRTKAILAVHVYGIPCDVEKIKKIAKKYNLKVIYDAAHAFGVTYKNKSLLNFGDISVLSFHATKLFQTVEGGAVITNDMNIAKKLSYFRNFGHKGYDEGYYGVGINGKMSEFHAAMGLSLLPYIKKLIGKRKKLTDTYNKLLSDLPISRPNIPEGINYNYAYYPIIFSNEKVMLSVKKALNDKDIFPRRYFYPAINTIPYVIKAAGKHKCPIAENISKRILCLPLYHDLLKKEQEKIVTIIANNL